MSLSPRQKLSAAITRVVGIDASSNDANKRGVAPYFGAVLRGLVRRETEGLGTLGVTTDGVLLWDPAFVETLTTDELAVILVHEVMHVVLKHHDRWQGMGVVPTSTSDLAEKAYVANIAGDLAINQELIKMLDPSGKGMMPAGGFLPDQLPKCFAGLKLPTGLIMEDYYHRLLQHLQQQKKQQPQQGQGQSGGGASSNQPGTGGGEGATNNPGKPRVGQGWCGSCAGHALPGEQAGKGRKESDGRSEAEMARMRKESAEAVRAMSSKNRGLVPESLQRWAEEELAPPKVPWREKLARIVRGAVAFKKGAVDLTWSRPSRRQAGVGFGIGRPIVPALHAPVPVVACALDVSGSMGPDLLAAALSELQGVLAATGAHVTFVVCDAEVHGIKPVKTVSEAMAMMKGGGGTVLEPAVKAMSELKPKPSIAIVMTDGYCDDSPSYGLNLIWTIVGGNTSFTPTHGEVIHVEEEAAK